MMFKTMQDDGGSHTSQYYIIDFKDKVATKYEDCYVGFKGYRYQRKLLYSKSLNNSEIELYIVKIIVIYKNAKTMDLVLAFCCLFINRFSKNKSKYFVVSCIPFCQALLLSILSGST